MPILKSKLKTTSADFSAMHILQTDEMWHQPHHGLGTVLGQVHITFDMDQPPQPRGTGVPQQAAFKQAAPCPHEVFADEPALFSLPATPGCLRHDLGQCLGPCIAACSRRSYAARLRAARAFLSGADDSPLRQIEQRIAAHSASLEFEAAGQLAPVRAALRWALESLGRLRVAKGEYSFVYPLRGADGPRTWYLIHGGLVAGCLPEPRSAAAARAAEIQLRATFAAPPPDTENAGVLAMDLLLLVTAWFRKRPGHLERTIAPAAALARCQARAARRLRAAG